MSKKLFRGQTAFQAGLAQSSEASTKGACSLYVQIEMAKIWVAHNANYYGVEG